jgi:tRNA threonylcarbamoyladenosine modification (KEOPS) complex  Pcc1 subunit
MKLEAEFDFSSEKAGDDGRSVAEIVYRCVREELEGEALSLSHSRFRSFIDLRLRGTKLNIYISAGANAIDVNVVTLRAAINTWLRLIKIAEEMVQVVRAEERYKVQ